MTQTGEGLPANQERGESLGPLVNELHYAVFVDLLEGKDGVLRWLSAEESTRYLAINFEAFDAYQKDPSSINPYRAVGPNWEILRFVEDADTHKTDVTSYVLSPSEAGVALSVLRSVDMPANPNATELRSYWAFNEQHRRERQFRLAITEPTDTDYQVLTTVLSELQELNEMDRPNDRIAFAIEASQARRAAGSK